MNHQDTESATAGTAAPSVQTSAPVTSGDDSTSLTTLQHRLAITPEDLRSDARARAWSRRLLRRIVEAADASAESYQSKL